tara:strand:+ start:943 stop:1272 length:330 start_codon:yes stop_codon:yes gene_type:complete
MTNEEAKKYLNGVCYYCEDSFYEIDKVDKMELRMELKPELKTIGLQEQRRIESLINQGYFNISRRKNKDIYYSYDARSNKVVKKKKRIVPIDKNRTIDVYEHLIKKYKG